jgi:hypothetical protein
MPEIRIERIDEAVMVRADFQGGVVTPVAFRRQRREHRITRINARWIERSGKHPSFFFSVTDDSEDVYQLQLQSAEMVWWLDSVALEG